MFKAQSRPSNYRTDLDEIWNKYRLTWIKSYFLSRKNYHADEAAGGR